MSFLVKQVGRAIAFMRVATLVAVCCSPPVSTATAGQPAEEPDTPSGKVVLRVGDVWTVIGTTYLGIASFTLEVNGKPVAHVPEVQSKPNATPFRVLTARQQEGGRFRCRFELLALTPGSAVVELEARGERDFHMETKRISAFEVEIVSP